MELDDLIEQTLAEVEYQLQQSQAGAPGGDLLGLGTTLHALVLAKQQGIARQPAGGARGEHEQQPQQPAAAPPARPGMRPGTVQPQRGRQPAQPPGRQRG